MTDVYYYSKDHKDKITKYDIIEMIRNEQKIALIKEYRRLSGLGLRESKDAIESGIEHHPRTMTTPLNGTHEDYTYNENKIIALFHEVGGPYGMSDTQFMNIIEKAVKNAKHLHFEDQLDAVETLCHNIRKKGGLAVIVRESEDFINAL